MNGNTELLNYVYQNSQMGVDTISQLMNVSNDEEFKKHMESQLDEYKEIHSAAKDLLNEHGYDEKGLSAFEKARTYLMINMQTLNDHSSSHISEMLIIGSNMGVIDAIKNLKKYDDAEPNIKGLMEKLLHFEEKNAQQLKKFLN